MYWFPIFNTFKLIKKKEIKKRKRNIIIILYFLFIKPLYILFGKDKTLHIYK